MGAEGLAIGEEFGGRELDGSFDLVVEEFNLMGMTELLSREKSLEFGDLEVQILLGIGLVLDLGFQLALHLVDLKTIR